MCCEWAALFTQKNLTEKQSQDLNLFSISHPILFLWIVVAEYKKERVKELVYQLSVALKEVYNDEDVERQMVRNSVKSCAGFLTMFLMAVVFYGYDAFMQTIRGGG